MKPRSPSRTFTPISRGQPLAGRRLDATSETTVPRLAGDALRPGGVYPHPLHGRRGQGAVRAALARGRLLDDRLLLLSSTLVPDPLRLGAAQGHAEHTPQKKADLRTFRARYAAVSTRVVRGRCAGCPRLPAVLRRRRFPASAAARDGDFPARGCRPVAGRLRAPTGTQLDGTEKVALQTSGDHPE